MIVPGMINHTQLLLLASVVIEQVKAVDDTEKTPLNSLAFVASLTKAFQYTGTIVPDAVLPVTGLNNPLAIIGELSLKLSDKSVTTWKDGDADMTSFDNVFTTLLDIDPLSPSSDAVTEGDKIIATLPPMIRNLMTKAMDVFSNIDAQQSTLDTNAVMSETKTAINVPFELDEESRALNAATVARPSSKQN